MSDIRHCNRATLTNDRSGLTVMEVLISIGVILVGLLGISALIPIAAEDANSAIRIDAAVRYASSITADLRSRGAGNLTNYGRRDNDPRNDDGSGTNNNPVFRPVALGFPNDSPSMRAIVPRSGILASFCIDPMLLSIHQTANEAGMVPNPRNAYDRSRFPYYNEYYNGVTEPNLQLTSMNGVPVPRMWRVAPIDPVTPNRFISPAIASRLSSSESELSFEKADDRLDPVGQVLSIYQYNSAGDETSGILNVASRQTENIYSWLATLTPPLDGSNTYKLSTVVLERRVVFDAPVSSDQIPYTTVSDRDNYQAERVVWIGDALSIGSTTEVDVYGNEKVSDKIVANQWVMLSAQPSRYVSGNVIPIPNAPAVHRWFRVLQVGPATKGTITAPDPVGAMNGWHRRLVLDGPNWEFSFDDNPSTTVVDRLSMTNDTFMTIVDGAVAVIESDLRVQ